MPANARILQVIGLSFDSLSAANTNSYDTHNQSKLLLLCLFIICNIMLSQTICDELLDRVAIAPFIFMSNNNNS